MLGNFPHAGLNLHASAEGLPEGGKHHDGGNEGDERGGVAYSVHLSECVEVARLETEENKTAQLTV